MVDHKSTAGWNIGIRVTLAIAGIVVIVAGCKAAAPIINYLLISMFLALICASPVFWLKRIGIPLGLSVTLVTTLILVTITLTTMILGQSLADLSASLPAYQTKLKETLDPLRDWLQNKDIELSAPTLFPDLDPQNILGLVISLLGNVGSILSNGLLILLTAAFLLLDTDSFKNKLRTISSDSTVTLKRVQEMIENVRHYIVLKAWISLVTGLCVGIWVAVLGLDFPVVWGILAFFFNFIPNIGSILAAIPAVLLALVQLGLWHAALVALGYLVVNFIIGYLIEPRIMGRGVGIPTSIIFLALIFWGWVLGPVGMILSVPLTVILKIVLAISDETRWLAILLGAENNHQSHE